MNKIDGINAAGAAASAGNTQISSAASASPAELNSWYEAMAKAWGSALDDQAGRIASMSGQISEAGSDQPSTMTVLTAESMRMQFMSQNASTSMTSIGQALESLGRKQ